mmetsp:Transcript_27334/g.62741  ORF Transcript_27334/g.62741 Transcript_27334/m.62741 type:complete len:109 (+) Transcript_27334:80-406(+)
MIDIYSNSLPSECCVLEHIHDRHDERALSSIRGMVIDGHLLPSLHAYLCFTLMYLLTCASAESFLPVASSLYNYFSSSVGGSYNHRLNVKTCTGCSIGKYRSTTNAST